jgi:hypothetical protein
MLGPGEYLLGCAEIVALAAFAWLGAGRARERLLPGFEGAPGYLASGVLALAILIWAAELLGSFGLFEPLPYLLVVAAGGVGLRVGLAGGQDTGERAAGGEAPSAGGAADRGVPVLAAIALAVAAIATVKFALELKPKLSTGMTGFDSTWYHAPFAAGFWQSGDTWDLHFIAPQFLAWFYPANGEVFHGVGMLAFDRDVLSPLLNLGWFMGCLLACWCIGRPYGVAPWSLALGAVALSVPALADQAGEARNDIVGVFFLLAAVAIAVNAWAERRGKEVNVPWSHSGGGTRSHSGGGAGPLLVVGLAAGLAAGTKLNFLLPAGVLVVGLAVLSPRGARWRALGLATLAALAGGGYWYLRNLAHGGNPLPWVEGLGPISLPAPDQALGGREAHSVFGYLLDGSVWSDWFLPGLADGLWFLWPLLLVAALAGLVLPLVAVSRLLRIAQRSRQVPGAGQSADATPGGRDGRGGTPELVLALAALVGIATALAWLVAPTSASGPDGMPRGFESGLRYLAPALVLGLALLPAAPPLRTHLRSLGDRLAFVTQRDTSANRTEGDEAPRSLRPGRGAVAGLVAALTLVAVALGYPVQRHYLEERYSDPSFTAPGLNAAFAWARDVSDSRIATTSTRQYPLFGTDLSNRVEFVGEERPHGGFEAPQTCRAWRRLVNAGAYDYVVASRDRLEPGKPPYPPAARWTAGPWAEIVLRTPPTVIYELKGQIGPSACR